MIPTLKEEGNQGSTPRVYASLKTKKSKDESMSAIKDSGYYVIGARTFSGGIWFLWDEDLVTINGVVQSNQAVHVVATMKQGVIHGCYRSAVYVDPHKDNRKELWKEFFALSQISDVAGWMAVGDFNTSNVILKIKARRQDSNCCSVK
ncbi:hypothetical protein FRX31_006940 [Thalictrum thalictroides]|uniref:Endonuclease/exonuclease/phosphatase n=1 Tax=Thalictrum thalictroides TaxID=46969 RepID=A0A7J6X2D0_THATH|nr:hypothetical protein FRX31_006940 [Thalictrum thalictroides]